MDQEGDILKEAATKYVKQCASDWTVLNALHHSGAECSSWQLILSCL